MTAATDPDREKQQRRALADMLLALVPMRMMELSAVEWHRLRLHLQKMSCEACGEGCRGAATIVGAHADSLMYAPNTKASAAARRALVDGLVIAALVADGGVRNFMGMHFCGRPHEGCPNPGGRPTVPRLVDDPPPQERLALRAMETLDLGAFGQAAL